MLLWVCLYCTSMRKCCVYFTCGPVSKCLKGEVRLKDCITLSPSSGLQKIVFQRAGVTSSLHIFRTELWEPHILKWCAVYSHFPVLLYCGTSHYSSSELCAHTVEDCICSCAPFTFLYMFIIWHRGVSNRFSFVPFLGGWWSCILISCHHP